MRTIVLVCLFGVLAFAAGQTEKEWWQSTVFYQIYPRSFKDDDGDGIGDIKGIISKLQHLKDSGITATWLSPVLEGPQVDFGYDISDFYKIDPIFGTNEDMDELLRQATALGIKIIFDFVPNHTSDQHQWFINSVNRVRGYENFYVWHDGAPNRAEPDARSLPPNNWQSVFSTRAWTWNEQRGQYYLHQFAVEQPDLNFREPRVVQAMKDVLTYWLEKGVAGFRVDAINHLFEDGAFRDEPLTGETNDDTNYKFTHKIYTKDQDEMYDMVQQWRNLVDEYSQAQGDYQRVMMTEAYTDIENTIRFYGTPSSPISHFPFNFGMIEHLDDKSVAPDFKRVIDEWLTEMPEGATANWVLGNHDRPRVGSRYGVERIDGMQMMLMVLPGVAVTYNGDEIGMIDNRDISWEDTLDPAACNTNPIDFVWESRDPVRTPFQWDSTAEAGFKVSNENRPWIQVHPDYINNNLALQKAAEKSHYKFYQQLVEFRKQNAFEHGSFNSHAFNDNVIGFKRSYGTDNYAILINFGEASQIINVNDLTTDFATESEVVLVSSTSTLTVGQMIQTATFELKAFDAIILKGINMEPEVTEPNLTTVPEEVSSIIPETTTDGSKALSGGIFLLIAMVLIQLMK